MSTGEVWQMVLGPFIAILLGYGLLLWFTTSKDRWKR